MVGEMVQSAGGYRVGEVVRISCEPANARVTRVTAHHVMLEWPWRKIDPDSRKFQWNGDVALSRDSGHQDWGNRPWRTDPDEQELSQGDVCIVGIVPVKVRITGIRRFDPPVGLGWLPHSELALGIVFLGDEDDPEAGDTIYLPSAEPIVIERLSGSRDRAL
jgi:hypothetical protein